MQLPEDIARQVYKWGIYANYDIIPTVDKKYTIGTHAGVLRCEAARHIVEKGIECGGIEIEIKSAFWISCHLPLNFKLWDLRFLDKTRAPILHKHLLLFPEIEQDIIIKVQTMMMHPEWDKHAPMLQRPRTFSPAATTRLLTMVDRLRVER